MEVVLRNGSLEATIAPAAAMLVTSLRHDGEELLGQRADAEAFVRTGKTTGAPLLYPWANRLSATRFEVAGKTVDVSEARRDAFGSPMHGLPEARRGWSAGPPEPDRIAGTLDWDVAAFGFPHSLRVEHRLTDRALITTTDVLGDAPVAFGWHPFLQLPGEPREDWRVEIGAATRLELDDRMLPTGRRSPRDPRGPPARRRRLRRSAGGRRRPVRPRGRTAADRGPLPRGRAVRALLRAGRGSRRLLRADGRAGRRARDRRRAADGALADAVQHPGHIGSAARRRAASRPGGLPNWRR